MPVPVRPLGGEVAVTEERPGSRAEKVTGPLTPRRAIGSAIRKLREDAGQSLQDVADELMISRSKLSRLENAQGRPLPRDIRDIIRHFEIANTPLADRLQRWVQDAQRTGWWSEYDVLTGTVGLEAHVAYETDAAIVRTYTLPFLPALLQTKDYATAYFRDLERRSSDEVDELIQVRLKRQEALASRDEMPPLELVAVTHESTLRQMVGSAEIMRTQLDALAQRPPTSNVQLYVLPFSAKPVFSMTCMYAYFEYQDADNLVHIETHAGFTIIDDPMQVNRYRRAHDALVHAALNEDESRALIRTIRDDWHDP
jgi:transcriptional regulator with XRE-family HTH domain